MYIASLKLTHKPQPSKPKISKTNKNPLTKTNPRTKKNWKRKQTLVKQQRERWLTHVKIEQQRVDCDVLWDWDLGE